MMGMDDMKPRVRLPLRFHRIFTIFVKVMGVIGTLILIRFLLLVRIGVPNDTLRGAMLDFPPPGQITGTGPFPLMLKFHKVAGSTVVESLWRNVQCPSSGLNEAWRETLCGNYDTHKNLLFVRGGLPYCTRTPSYKIIAIFRQPVTKLISTLYWYPPYRLRKGSPWSDHIGNWTIQDVNYMLSKLSADRNPALQPPLQEYTAVLGRGLAHSGPEERQKLSGHWAEDEEGDLYARRRAVAHLHEDESLVIGLTERLDASMVLIALSLGWPVDSMQYQNMKSTSNLKVGDNRFNVNSGKYHLMSDGVKNYMKKLLKDDEHVYGVATDVHNKQTGSFPNFQDKVNEFKMVQERPNRSIGCPRSFKSKS